MKNDVEQIAASACVGHHGANGDRCLGRRCRSFRSQIWTNSAIESGEELAV